MTEKGIHSRNRESRRAVFLDRDGTINKEVHYLKSPDDFSLLNGVGKAIKDLNKANWLVVVISNQSGISRGYFSVDTLNRIHEKMADRLAQEDAHIDAIYYCPHHPDDGCSCRKPNAGMIFQAAQELNIDLPRSWMIGDKLIDIETGKNAGCRTILVLTGYGQDESTDGQEIDYVADALGSAVEYILSNERN